MGQALLALRVTHLEEHLERVKLENNCHCIGTLFKAQGAPFKKSISMGLAELPQAFFFNFWTAYIWLSDMGSLYRAANIMHLS
jgi:hypothetical protein